MTETPGNEWPEYERANYELYEQRVERLGNGRDPGELAAAVGQRPVCRINVRARQDTPLEAKLSSLANPQGGLGDAPDLSGKANLAKYGRGFAHRPVPQAGGHGRRHAQVGRRLVEPHAAGDVDEHVLADQVEPGALLQDGQQQGQPSLVDARGH